MNSAELLQKTATLFPGPLTLAIVLSPAHGYELPKDLAAAACFAIFIASLVTRSDGLHAVALSGLAALLGLAAIQAGLLLSFATVSSLFVLFDLVSIVKSLFGLTYTRIGLQSSGTTSTYLGIAKKQTVRSFGVCFATFLISIAVLSTPIPQLTFANPVSGSGLLALSTLLLILLAASGTGLPRRAFRIRRPTQVSPTS